MEIKVKALLSQLAVAIRLPIANSKFEIGFALSTEERLMTERQSL